MAATTENKKKVRHFLQPKDVTRGGKAERFRAVEPLVAGKRVLDIGAAWGYWREDWMHRQMAAVAAELRGIDRDPESVAKAREQGFDIVLADAGDIDLGERFEVVFAGELIEHLDSVRSFLDTAERHLEPGGQLVLTTPNAFAISNFVYRIGGRPWVNPDHTCWFCEDTMRTLLQRCGWRVDEIRYIEHRTPGRVRAVAAGAVRAVLPDRVARNTMLVVASRP